MLFDSHIEWSIPTPETYPQAMFGAIRKHDIHTGIDIYVPDGTLIYPIVPLGIIVNIEWFTGPNSNPPTPWWNATEAIWIRSNDSNEVWVYGELAVNRAVIKIGSVVTDKDCIGIVSQVLKKDKGLNPTSMLHIELYESMPNQTAIWNLNKPKPDLLLDPTSRLDKR